MVVMTSPGGAGTTVRSFAAPKDESARKRKQIKAPKNKRSKENTDTQQKSQNQKEIDNIVAALDAPIRYEPTITSEEQERRRQIVRNYCIGRFEQHNEREHDLNSKMTVKLHAVRMLPNNTKLKEAAFDRDIGDELPEKEFPMWTPPIPGFNLDDYDEYIEEKD